VTIDMNNGFFDLRQGPTTRVDNPMECPSTVVAEAARTLITFSAATIIHELPNKNRSGKRLTFWTACSLL
jgi:alpha-glucosidase